MDIGIATGKVAGRPARHITALRQAAERTEKGPSWLNQRSAPVWCQYSMTMGGWPRITPRRGFITIADGTPVASVLLRASQRQTNSCDPRSGNVSTMRCGHPYGMASLA